jgi:hypothetical protein
VLLQSEIRPKHLPKHLPTHHHDPIDDRLGIVVAAVVVVDIPVVELDKTVAVSVGKAAELLFE